MNIETKYSLGDKVWKINQNKPKKWIPCPFCGGSKYQQSTYADFTKVTGLDGSRKRCPECQGRGGSNKYLELEWRVDGSLVIGNVRFDATEGTIQESYMANHHGGTVHYVDTLYPTKKEAQAECDKRNDESQ